MKDWDKQKLEDLQLNTALLAGAALRYVVVADWFEDRSVKSLKSGSDEEAAAFEAFARVERELRKAALPLISGWGHRQEILNGVLNERKEVEDA